MSVSKRKSQGWLVIAGVGISLLLASQVADATVLDNFGNAVLGILNGTFLRTVAIAAIIGTGLMALSGRIQWGQFAIVLLAVVIIFGAAGIVDYIKTNAATAMVTTPVLFGHVV